MTYAALAAIFVLASGVIAAVTSARRGLDGRWWAATGLTITALVILTIIFDSLMIISDLFRFNDDLLLGVRLWQAPVEDLAWPVAAGLLLPSLAAWGKERHD